MAMDRERMIDFVLRDIKDLRSEKSYCLLLPKNCRIRGYAGAMWHSGLLLEREYRALLKLLDNAEMYAKRECKY